MRLFKDRAAAAEELAEHLAFLKAEQPIVVALDNGGVPLAEVLAMRLNAPLDIVFIENLYSPKVPSQAVGAVDEHGRISMIQTAARWHHLSSQQMIGPAREMFKKIFPRASAIREVLPELDVSGRTVVIVSDGISSGASMLGAIASMRGRGAGKIVAAAPAGPEKALWQLHEAADVVVIPHRPAKFRGVDRFYEHFTDVSDALVEAIVNRWLAKRGEKPAKIKTIVVRVPTVGGAKLHCELDLPPGADKGSGPFPAVIFAHGMDSHGGSPLSMPISQRLARRRIIGVRPDFTGHGYSEGTTDECTDGRLLADLSAVSEQLKQIAEIGNSCVGLNGSGIGGKIALHFAARHPELKALVLRSPICDDEAQAAHQIRTPTLLIHAEQDLSLSDSVESLDHELAATHQLLRIPESTRLFTDAISRELMVNASVNWFTDHLLVAAGGARTTPTTQHRPEPTPSHQ